MYMVLAVLLYCALPVVMILFLMASQDATPRLAPAKAQARASVVWQESRGAAPEVQYKYAQELIKMSGRTRNGAVKQQLKEQAYRHCQIGVNQEIDTKGIPVVA